MDQLECAGTMVANIPHTKYVFAFDTIGPSGFPESYDVLPMASFRPTPVIAFRNEEFEWEAHRSIITQLYLEQDLSMAALIKNMAENYNFKAAKWMYHT
jgi:Clr5 domain